MSDTTRYRSFCQSLFTLVDSFCYQTQVFCVLVLSACTTIIWAADTTPVFESEVVSISTLLQQESLSLAQDALDEFWTEHSTDDDFVDAVRRIKDVYWQEADHAVHYALCDRIIKEFPDHPLTVATRADVVRGYIYDNDLTKAADKLEEFWTYGHSDEKFLEYARQIKDLYWEKQEYTAHFTLCDRIIKEFPDHPLGVLTRADVVRGYVYNKDLDTAAEKLEEFLSQPADSAAFRQAVHEVGQAYRWEGNNPSKGREIYSLWLDKYSDDPKSYTIQCAVVKSYLEEDDIDGANTALDRYKQLCAGREDVYEETMHLADVYQEKKHPEQSLELYQWFIAAYPQHKNIYQTYVSQIDLCIKNEKRSQADAAVEELLTKSSDSAAFREAVHTIGQAYRWQANDPAKGREVYNHWLSLYSELPDSYIVQCAVVLTYLEENDIAGANTALGQFKQLCIGRANVDHETSYLVDRFNDKNQMKTSVELCQWYIDQHPDNDNIIAYQDSIVRTHLAAGQTEAAQTELNAMGAFKENSEYVRRVHELGGEFSKSKDYSTALKIYADLKKQYPDHERAPWFQRSIVQTYLELGDEEGIDRELNILLSQYSVHPSFVEQAQQMAVDFDSRKKTDKVIQTYTSLLNTLPDHDQTIRFHGELIKGYMKKGLTDQSDMLMDTLANEYQANPDYAKVVNELGDSYRNQKEYVKSIDVYRQTFVAKSSQEDSLGAYAGIAKAAVWLNDRRIDPNSFVVAAVDPNSSLVNETMIDSVIQKLMAYYEDTGQQDYRVFEIAEEYCFRAQEAKLMGNKQQAQADMSRAVNIWKNNVSKNVDSGYECLMYYTIANAYQRIEDYEVAIDYFQQVLTQWPQFDRNWYAQYMIVRCYEGLFRNRMISEQEAKAQIINACREFQERYPDANVIVAVEELQQRFENLNPTL